MLLQNIWNGVTLNKITITDFDEFENGDHILILEAFDNASDVQETLKTD